jgi:hypothetical protein
VLSLEIKNEQLKEDKIEKDIKDKNRNRNRNKDI